MNGCGVKFYYKNKEEINMSNYSDFDNEYNKKIFLEIYKDEKK